MKYINKVKKFNIFLCFLFAICALQLQFCNISFGIDSPILVKKIVVTGSKRLDKSSIVFYSGISKGELVGDSEIQDAISSMYATKYFESVDIDINKQGVLKINVKESYLIDEVKFKGFGSVSKIIESEAKTQSKGWYSKSDLAYDSNLISQAFEKTGRFDINLDVKVAAKENNTIDVIFDLDEGDISRRKYASFPGLYSFSEYSIKQELGKGMRKSFSPFSIGSFFEKDRMNVYKISVNKFLQQRGFLDSTTKVTAEYNPITGHVQEVFSISQGSKYKFGESSIQYDQFYGDIEKLNEKKVITSKAGKVYNVDEVHKTIKKIQKALGKQGIISPDITPIVNKDKQNKVVGIQYKVEKSQSIKRIGSIKVYGTRVTKENVIRKELLFSEGDTYSEEKVSISKSKLMLLGLFKNVEIKEVATPYSDVVDMEVLVEESSQLDAFNIQIGYASQLGGILGMLSITRSNIMGTGTRVSASGAGSVWMKMASLDVTMPKIGNTDFRLGGNFGFTEFGIADSSALSALGGAPLIFPYLQRSFSLGTTLSIPITDYIFGAIKVEGRYDTLMTSQNPSVVWSSQAGSYILPILTTSLGMDTRDRVVFANQGFTGSIRNSFIGFGISDLFFSSLEGNASIYLPVIPDYIVLALRAQGGTLNTIGDSEDVPLVYRYNVGYMNFPGFFFSGIGPRVAYYEDGAEADTFDLVTIDRIGLRANSFVVFSIEPQFSLPVLRDYNIRLMAGLYIGTAFGSDAENTSVDKPYKRDVGSETHTIVREEVLDSASWRISVGGGIIWHSPMGPLQISIVKPVKSEFFDQELLFRIGPPSS